MISLYHRDCGEHLDRMAETGQKARLIFADPPDNLGLAYDEFKDKLPPVVYYSWLEALILKSMLVADVVWFS